MSGSSEKLININFSDDPYYRYKMPMPQVKKEGFGNGRRTVIPNMRKIATMLHREPEHVTKWFSVELGAQATYNPATGFATINGTHVLRDVLDLLKKFNFTFVLCPKCKAPETELMAGERRVEVRCKACSYSGFLPDHRLSKFIEASMMGTTTKTDETRRKPRNPLQQLQTLARDHAEASVIVEELRSLRQSETIGPRMRIPCLVAALSQSCDSPTTFISKLEDHAPYYIAACASEDESKQLGREILLLRSVEALLKRWFQTPDLKPAVVSGLFQNLFVLNVISNEAFEAWKGSECGRSIVSDRVHEEMKVLASGFLDWLATDEGEEEAYSEYSDYDYEDDESLDDDLFG